MGKIKEFAREQVRFMGQLRTEAPVLWFVFLVFLPAYIAILPFAIALIVVLSPAFILGWAFLRVVDLWTR